MPVSRSKRPLASTASCASEPISASTASIRRRSSAIGRAADLHLHDGVAALEVAAHLGPERRVVLARIVVAAGGVDEDPRVRLAALAFGDEAEEGLAGDLGRRVPYRHVERSDGDRALAVASRLLVRHHGGPDPVRIEIAAALVEKALGRRLQDAVAEALADEAALAVPSVRVEAVADDAPPVAHDIGDDRHEARGHLREIDVGVTDRRGDRLGDLANVDDAHVGVSLMPRTSRGHC